MRKHDVRKWLHAILDLLPVIIIPVFMIYSHRHTIDSYQIETPQYKYVDFNQLNNNAFPVIDNVEVNGITINSIDDFHISFVGTNSANVDYPIYSPRIDLVGNHKYYVKTYYVSDYQRSYLDFRYTIGSTNYSYYGVDSHALFEPQYDCWAYTQYFFLYQGTYNVNVNFSLQIFDFTQMFGRGNEPTIAEFNDMFTDSYYDYTLSKPLLLDDGVQVFNETDIGSQMFYCLYNSVDKYFNMGNVFNLNDVYTWFNLNIFHGTAPVSLFVVWNIVLYEFVMDLLFLLYGLFMWFIDMVEKLMEKPLKSVK